MGLEVQSPHPCSVLPQQDQCGGKGAGEVVLGRVREEEEEEVEVAAAAPAVTAAARAWA